MRAAATATRERDGLAEKLSRSEVDSLQAITACDAEIERLARAQGRGSHHGRAVLEATRAGIAGWLTDAAGRRRPSVTR